MAALNDQEEPVHELRVGCFDTDVVVHTDDDVLAELLATSLQPLVRTGPDAAAAVFEVAVDLDAVVLRRDGVLAVGPAPPGRVLRELLLAINQVVIDGAGDHLLLHAAAADLDGAAVLLPAAMEAGKTTLVTGLLDRGLGYLTDEAARVGADRVLAGYPKPLSVDPGSWDVLAHHAPDAAGPTGPWWAEQWQLAPQLLAPVVATSRLRLVVFPQWEAGAATSLERLAPADAVVRAVGCTFVTGRPHLPTARLRTLAGVMEAVPAYALRHGDLGEACDEVVRLLRAASAAASA